MTPMIDTPPPDGFYWLVRPDPEVEDTIVRGLGLPDNPEVSYFGHEITDDWQSFVVVYPNARLEPVQR